MKLKAFTVGALALALSSTAVLAEECKPFAEMPTVEKGFLTVAVVSYAPYSFIDRDGKLDGVDGAILAEVAKMNCLEVKPLPSDAGSGIQSVLSRKADVSTGAWYRTAERNRVVDLSDPLYLDQTAIYSKDGASKLSELEEGILGSVQGNLWVNDIRAIMGDRLKLYPDSISMQQDLLAGRIPAAIDGNSIGIVAQQQGALAGITIKILEPDERVKASKEAGQGTFPMNKRNPEFTTAMNASIAELHGKGKIKEILASFGLDPSAADTGPARLIE